MERSHYFGILCNVHVTYSYHLICSVLFLTLESNLNITLQLPQVHHFVAMICYIYWTHAWGIAYLLKVWFLQYSWLLCNLTRNGANNFVFGPHFFKSV